MAGTAKDPVIIPDKDTVLAGNSFARWLEARAEAEDTSGFMIEQIGNILLSDNEDEMWDADELDDTPSSKDIIDVEMSVMSFTVQKGQAQYEESILPYFMVVRAARLDTGAEFTFTTGAPLIMAKLKFLEDHRQLPAECAVRTGKTKKGYTVLKLRKVPGRAVKAR